MRIRDLVCIAALGLCGCDTVAELTFQSELPVEAVVQGFVPTACGVDSGADAVLRFGVLTSFDRLLEPGRVYASQGGPLVPGENFRAQDVSVADGWFFVVQTGGGDMPCADASSCPEGAVCVAPDEMGLSEYYYAPSKVCAYPTRIDVLSDPRFTHFQGVGTEGPLVASEHAQGRSFAFAIDNSATLDGSDGDGIATSERATDPWEYRKVGIHVFMDALGLTGLKSPRYEFSAHLANGLGVAGVFESSEPWLRTVALWNAQVMEKYPTPSGRSPIWEAASAALEKLTASASPSYSHSLVAFTDGDPDGSTGEAEQSFRRGLMSTGRVALHWLELTSGEPYRPYADMVALGCGTHYLFDNPVILSRVMRTLALNTESHWDVPVRFSARLPEGYSYRLATVVTVTVGNAAVAFAAQRVQEENETLDYRMMVTR